MHFGEPGQAIDFPFFIEWADGDDERLAQLEASGAINMKQSITMESVQFFCTRCAGYRTTLAGSITIT